MAGEAAHNSDNVAVAVACVHAIVSRSSLEMVASGLLRPDRLIGEGIGLESAAAALAAMSGPASGHGVSVIEMSAVRSAVA